MNYGWEFELGDSLTVQKLKINFLFPVSFYCLNIYHHPLPNSGSRGHSEDWLSIVAPQFKN